MNKEELIKQRCEIDKITEEEFEKTYRVVDCNCGAPYCKGYRCLDLDDLLKENQELKEKLDKYENPEDMTLFAMWCTEKVKEENEKLKKQFEVGEEQYNDLVEEKEKLQEQLSSNTLQLEKLKKQVNKGLYNVCLPYKTGYNKAIKDKETQQKEFIKYLENKININPYDISDYAYEDIINRILSKYKEIIGDDK